MRCRCIGLLTVNVGVNHLTICDMTVNVGANHLIGHESKRRANHLTIGHMKVNVGGNHRPYDSKCRC